MAEAVELKKLYAEEEISKVGHKLKSDNMYRARWNKSWADK